MSKNRQVKAKQVTCHTKKNLQYYEISAKKCCYSFEKLYLYLARKLSGSMKSSALALPPEVQIVIANEQQYGAELHVPAAQPLPDNGDEDAFEYFLILNLWFECFRMLMVAESIILFHWR